VEALRIDTSAKHLKFIILNNHDEDELKRTLTRTKLIALFKGACNMEDLDNLVSITTSRQILLYGETMVNYQVMQQLALGMSEEEKATMRARELAVETDSERLARREAEIMSLLSEGMTAAHLGGFRYTL
jgi:DNA-binding NarL/FixJ family response regulator